MQTCKLLRDDTVLLSQPKLIEEFGRAGAQFLSQLHYWLEKSNCGQQHHGQKWIYNTEASWADQLKLSVRQFRRHVASLTNKGIIFVQKLNPHKSNRTNYFSINYELLNSLLENTENVDFVHEDIMALPSGQNDPFYNDTKTTNKDFNKSDVGKAKPQEISCVSQNSQVAQVSDLNIKTQEKLAIKTEVLDQVNLAIAAIKLEEIQQENPPVKTSTAQDMLKIWNENFANKAKTKLSKSLAPLLVAAFKTMFDSDLKNWLKYCEQIRSSSYLMAESFNLNISWALKFAIIERIRAGELGVQMLGFQNQESEDGNVLEQAQIKQMIASLPESSKTKNLRYKIAQVIGYPEYFSWFHQAEFVEQVNGEIKIVAPNAFFENIWEQRYSWVCTKN